MHIVNPFERTPGEMTPQDRLSDLKTSDGNNSSLLNRSIEIEQQKDDEEIAKSYEEKLIDLKEFLQDQKDLLEALDTSKQSSSKSSSEVPFSERESSSNSSSVDFGSSDVDNVFFASPKAAKHRLSLDERGKLEHPARGRPNYEEYSHSENLTKEFLHRIATMVEYYLSDENLSRDMFLLKHVVKNREGYISLKLLSNYKKVKRISKNWSQVKLALKDSALLEINSEGTKVRRKLPLPPELEINTRPFRSVLAYDIPLQKASMDKLAEIFGAFGEINSLQIYKPKGRVSQEMQIVARHKPFLLETICAIIEYENVHHALHVINSLEDGKHTPMRVIELQNNLKGKNKNKNLVNNESCYYSASEVDEEFSPYGYRSAGYDSSSTFSSTCVTPFFYCPPVVPDFNYLDSHCEWRPRCKMSTKASMNERNSFRTDFYPQHALPQESWVPLSSPLPRRQFHKESCAASKKPQGFYFPVEWTNKKKMAAGPLHQRPSIDGQFQSVGIQNVKSQFNSCPNTPFASPMVGRRNRLSQGNVIRMPIGPDGTQGFQMCRVTNKIS